VDSHPVAAKLSVILQEMLMDEVEIKLTKDEALVLFDFLSRFSNEDKLVIDDQAEERALWNLTCVFEKSLAEPFDTEWKTIIEAARNRLRDEC
jgi:hypothetical protein